MKNKFIVAAAAILSAALITSCSIQKRHYMSGYHVEWNNSNNKTNGAANEQEEVQAVTQDQSQTRQDIVTQVAKEEGTAAVQPTQSGVSVTENQVIVPNAGAVGTETPGAITSKPDKVKQGFSLGQGVKSAMAGAEKSSRDDVPKGLLIVLCFLIPWLAVGLATNWDVRTLIINLLWSLTCIGAIIHALIVVNRETK